MLSGLYLIIKRSNIIFIVILVIIFIVIVVIIFFIFTTQNWTTVYFFLWWFLLFQIQVLLVIFIRLFIIFHNWETFIFIFSLLTTHDIITFIKFGWIRRTWNQSIDFLFLFSLIIITLFIAFFKYLLLLQVFYLIDFKRTDFFSFFSGSFLV